MVVVGEVPLTVDRAGFSPLAGAFTPVLIHEHGTRPLPVTSRDPAGQASHWPGEEGGTAHEPHI